MNLTAHARGCISRRFVLKLDGRPRGELNGRMLSEGLDIRLIGRNAYAFERRGLFAGSFELLDDDCLRLRHARRRGILTTAWELQLYDGPARMFRDNCFTSSFNIMRGHDLLATAHREDICSRGWLIRPRVNMVLLDLLMIGCLYHIILNREANTGAGVS